MNIWIENDNKARRNLETAHPRQKRPADCKRERKLLLHDNALSLNEASLAIRDVFGSQEPGLTLQSFVNRSGRFYGFRPAGAVHAYLLLSSGIPIEWQSRILVFPGTVVTLADDPFACFCVPILYFVDGTARNGYACSYDLVSPDYCPVLISSDGTTH